MPVSGNANPILKAIPTYPEVTLLELVQAVSDETSDDREVVETVRDLLLTGQVVLRGNFRSVAPSVFC